MQILIVEDDPTSMTLANKILIKENYNTIQANSVKEAMEKIKESPNIDMVLCDVFLPDANGFSLIRYIRSNPVLSKTRIVMCSSMSDKTAILTSLRMGADDYILKPLDPSVLITKVKRIKENAETGKILIVDDEKDILDILARGLAMEGYEVLMAESAEEALEIFDTFKIAAVITDIEMPGIDGLGLTALIKDKKPHIPVFLITGHCDKYKRDIMTKAGANGFIKKPFKNTEIISRLKEYVLPTRNLI